MARRKNRYNAIQSSDFSKTNSESRSYRVALYARLSVDNTARPSDSIESQLMIMRNFLKKQPELTEVNEFIDRGYTGTNFKRPAFEEMMQEVRKGRINCIVVKDMSRLGRDYLETSNYIETIFPFLGVRFISVNDHFDTCAEFNGNKELEIALKNLVNDMYAKDISKRVAVSRKQEIERGRFTGSNAPYGYKVNEDHPLRQYLIDTEAAHVVQEIFELAVQGYKLREIAVELQVRNYSIPGQYLKTGNVYQGKKNEMKKWHIGTISNILKNQAYIGNLVQGKRRKRLCNGEKQVPTDESKWIVIEHAHEPIITEEVFWRVRKMLTKRKEDSTFSSDRLRDIPVRSNKYKGLLYCGVCGKLLSYASETRGTTTRQYFFYCRDNYDLQDVADCHIRITERVLEDILKCTLGNVLRKFNERTGQLVAMMEQKRKQLLASLRREEKKILRQIELNNNKEAKQYEAYVMGAITKAHFLKTKSEMERAGAELKQKLQEMEEKKHETTHDIDTKEEWLLALEKSVDEKPLEQELIQTLVKKIIVYPGHKLEIIYPFEDITKEVE